MDRGPRVTVVAGLLAVSVIVQQVLHRREVTGLLDGAAKERQVLIGQVQHPERAVVEPGVFEPVAPPTDAAELAQVGLVVPEFVNVGREE